MPLMSYNTSCTRHAKSIWSYLEKGNRCSDVASLRAVRSDLIGGNTHTHVEHTVRGGSRDQVCTAAVMQTASRVFMCVWA